MESSESRHRSDAMDDGESQEQAPSTFRGWRLLAGIMLIVVVLAVISAVVDWVVIGPLEGRAPWL